jgi:hypothetical protein
MWKGWQRVPDDTSSSPTRRDVAPFPPTEMGCLQGGRAAKLRGEHALRLSDVQHGQRQWGSRCCYKGLGGAGRTGPI